jgi:ketosteroid isomerase-like protein
MKDVESNVELVRAGFAAVERGDYDVIAGLLAPDVKWHGGDPAAGCQSRDETLAFIRGAMSRTRARLVDVIEAGPDRVVVVLAPPGEPGRPEPPRRANVTTLRDGRVVEMVAYETPADACAAVGLPPPAS